MSCPRKKFPDHKYKEKGNGVGDMENLNKKVDVKAHDGLHSSYLQQEIIMVSLTSSPI